MTLKDYNKLYWDIVDMANDCDGFALGVLDDDIPTEEEIEKCKYIAAMINTIADVPAGRVRMILERYKQMTEEEYEQFEMNIERE